MSIEHPSAPVSPPFVSLLLSTPQNSLLYPVAIPNDSALAGVRLFAQAFCACRAQPRPWSGTSIIGFTIR